MERRTFITLLFIAFTGNMLAQQKFSESTQKVFDACWALRTAISAGNTASMKSANEDLKKCRIRPFSSLHPQASDTTSLNGHFVWDETFVDSLIAGRDVRKFAQRYAESRSYRGSSGSRGRTVYIKSFAVKGKGVARFSFVSEKHQEFAVIAEPHGNVTLRMFCKKTKKWHNDDQDVKRGRAFRQQVFDFPEGVKDTVGVEVINCGKKDISFVVISN